MLGLWRFTCRPESHKTDPRRAGTGQRNPNDFDGKEDANMKNEELYGKIDTAISGILDKIAADLPSTKSYDSISALRELACTAQTLGSVRQQITNSTPRD
jgi:hypothetical protein